MRKLPNYLLLALLCLIGMWSCDKKESKPVDYDPNSPIVFSDFIPKTGAVRTRLFIEGKNFGRDISKIKVYIGDKELRVIGADDKQIYCMVPKQVESGALKVVIDRDGGIEHIFDDNFTYRATSTVGTLVGDVDELGNSSIIDGSFLDARFSNPMWVLFEPVSNSLFVVETALSVRKVDLNEETVATLITNGQASFKKIQTISLSFDNDTLFLTDDNGQTNNKNQVAIAYTLRNENYRRVHPYIYDYTSYACASHPLDNIMFFNTYIGGGILKAFTDPMTQEMVSKELFKVGGTSNIKPNIFFHPSGDYAYFMIAQTIWKSKYNWETKELEFPIVFAGGSSGDVDAIGTTARFGYIRQGVFVKNPEYAGQQDEYDFYLADIDNHSIRKLTPTGEVSTYAGKGSPSSDGKKSGYIDGDLRLEARFNKPSGIAYDDQNKIFYITEEVNKRIRTISVE